MTTEAATPLHITGHDQLDEAIAYQEIRAKTPVVDEHGSCLDFVLIPITPVQAHEMLREAIAHDTYDMCLKAQYDNEEEVHLEISASSSHQHQTPPLSAGTNHQRNEIP